MSGVGLRTDVPAEAGADWRVVAACAAVMLVEGFDLLIYGNAIPSLLHDAAMGIDKAAAGRIGSAVFVGMLLGGIAAGRVVAALGLVRALIPGFLLFTVATAGIALVGNGLQLGLLRFLAGLGLGVVLPATLSLARASVGPRHGALAISIVMAGLPVGGMLAAVVSLQLIPLGGWRPLFLAGGALGLAVLVLLGPVLARAARRIADPAAPAGGGGLHGLFNRASCPVLLIGALATLADLLAWYGISTWLTQLMREFEIPFAGAMQMMFTLNIGAIVGSLLTAALAIRLGTRAVAVVCGVVAAACLVAIAARVLPSWGLFAVIALLGMSAISAQNLVNALVADAFPARWRAAAIGLTLGVGRLGAVIAPTLGGQILAAGHGASWVLLAFALAALLGAVLLLALGPRRVQACVDSL